MRALFPYFQNANSSVTSAYLDSAATTQKLQTVIDATVNFYTCDYATVNRAGYASAAKATQEYENVRVAAQGLLGASDASEVVFTSGATQSLNIIANGLLPQHLNGSTVLVMASEHHANLLPWQQMCSKYNLTLEVFDLNTNGQFDESTRLRLLARIDDTVALIAIAHVSNLLGNVYPIADVCAKAFSTNTLTVVDGTQAIAHMPVNVESLDCDFYVCSAHKMYGPTGVGLLYGKSHLLDSLIPSQLGGEMVTDVSFSDFTLQASPLKFEAGTGNLAGIIGFKPAIEFITTNITQIISHEVSLFEYAMDKLKTFADIDILGNDPFSSKQQASIAIIAFTHKTINTHDFAMAMYQQNIALRAGQHCAIPMIKRLNIENCLRLSLSCYNTYQDIDACIDAIKKAIHDACAQPDMANTHTLPKQTSESVTSTLCANQNLPLARAIQNVKGWDNKYRQLLLASKQLKILAPEARDDATIITGCESNLWLQAKATDFPDKLDGEQSFEFRAYSGSKIIRGLLSTIIEKAEYQSIENLAKLDIISYLDELGLGQYFSKGRRDGVVSIAKRISELAVTALNKSD